MYKHYEHMPPLQMIFHLNNIPSGTYRIKRSLLDRFHGSYLDIQLGELVNGNIDEETFLYEKLSPFPEDMNYLSSACIPEERVLYMQVKDRLTVTSPIYPQQCMSMGNYQSILINIKNETRYVKIVSGLVFYC